VSCYCGCKRENEKLSGCEVESVEGSCGAELRRIQEGFGDSRENFAIVKALSEGKPG